MGEDGAPDGGAEAARAVVERYLHALQAFDLDATLDCFTPDAVYSHPPYRDEPAEAPRHEVVGHAGLRRLFEARGPRPTAHHLDVVARAGDEAFASGLVTQGGTAVASFLAHLRLAPDGRIAAYAAYASAPPVGWESGA
ncbi:MAG: nuclear transport factor 2 family protein [Acidimicrobiia bacterium]